MRTSVMRLCVGLASSCCILLVTMDVQAAGEGKAIAKLIQSVSHAMVDLPKTKNVNAVLQYFAVNYTFLEDGEFKTFKDLEEVLWSFAAEKPSEELIEIKDDVVNLKAHVVGAWAWATYDETFIAMSSGHILDEDISKCTGIFRKTKGRWLYVHEHCSEGVGESPASNGVLP